MRHSDYGRPLRGVVRDVDPARRLGNLRRRDRPGHPQRPDGDLPGQERDPRVGRRRPVLPADDERADLHRRRDRPGLPGRRAADGHGDGPVPPDDARRERLPDHRGRPRRGRSPAQQRRRAVHGAVRPEQDGARLAGRRLAGRADGDPRGSGRRRRRQGHLSGHHRRPEEADPRVAAGDRQHRTGLRRRRHHPRADRHPAGPALHHGWREDRQRRGDERFRPVRGRRGRVRVGPRRKPPRRELAARHADLRTPQRRARGGPGEGDGDAAGLRRAPATTTSR